MTALPQDQPPRRLGPRLAVLVPSVGAAQPDQAIERRGPAVTAGLDASGQPTKALSGFANYYVRVLLRLGVRDVTAGFKLWRASTLTAIDVASVRSNGYSFQVEMNYRSVQHGLKIVELPIHFADRREGDSKMSLKVQLESAVMPLSLRRRAR